MRKIKAHYIFDGKILHKLATLSVATDGTIIGIEQHNDKEEANTEFYSGIICPGFVNAHCHIELSHLHKAIPMHTGLPKFISGVVSQRNSINDAESAMHYAEELLLKAGVVAVGDISNTADSFKLKKQSSIYFHTFLELFDLGADTQKIYNDYKSLYKTYMHDLSLSLSPHAPYSCSRTLIERISEHAQAYNYPISIHNQEDASENDFFESASGSLFDFFSSRNPDLQRVQSHKNSIHTYSPWLPDKNHILFIHNTHTTADDIRFLKQLRPANSFTFVVCPLSNEYIAHELPPIDMFARQGVAIAIGTDSLASNHTLSIIDELHYIHDKFPDLPLELLLRAATHNGAKALGIERNYGSFASGTQPGVLLIEQADLVNKKIAHNTTVSRLL